MKLDRIILENFGIYTRQVFQFDHAPLVLIYGANESGKTTALNGIRQAMFGFRTRTPYLTGATMQAEVSAQLINGEQLEFTRRKGRPDDVRGTLQGSKLVDRDLPRLLGGLDLDSYEHLFGFSQEELRRGQDTLKSARLTEALAGGSMGGIHALEQLRLELSQSLEQLYKPRKTTSKIHVKLADIRQGRERLRETEVLPPEVEELRRRRHQLQQQSLELQNEYETVHRQRGLAQKKASALPVFLARRAVQAQLEALDIPAKMDSAFVVQWEDTSEQRKTLMERLQEEEKTLESERSRFQALGGESELLKHEKAIEVVGHQASEVATRQQQLQELKRQNEEARQACRDLLESLQLEEVNERVLAFSIGVPQRQQLESLSQRFVGIGQEMLAVNIRVEAAQETLQSAQADSATPPPPENWAELSGLTNRLVDSEREAQQQTRALEQELADPAYRELTRRLSSRLPSDVTLDVNWRVPLEQTVAQHQAADEELDRQKEQLLASRVALENERKEIAQTRVRGDSGDAGQLREMAQQLAQQRDTILDAWLAELSQPLMAASITPQQQRDRLHEFQQIATTYDETYAQLLELADTVAAENQQRKRIEKLTEQISGTDEQLVALENQLADRQQQWQQLWASLPWPPASPVDMSDWLRDFETWRKATERHGQVRLELERSQDAARMIRGQLLKMWPSEVPEDVDCSVFVERVRQWELQSRELAQEKLRTRNAEQSIAHLTDKRGRLENEQQEVAEGYADWLSNAPVAEDWPVEEVKTLLDSLERLKREHHTVQHTTEQIAVLERTLCEFENAVGELREQLQTAVGMTGGEAETVEHLSSQQQAERWLKTLHADREQRSQRVQLATGIDHKTQRIQEMQTRLQDMDGRLATLCAQVGDYDVASVSLILQRVRDAERLRRELAEHSAALASLETAEQNDGFLTALESAEETSLELEVQECTRRLEELQQARKETDRNIGSLRQQLEQLAGNQAAQRHLQHIHQQRGELAELAEQWVVERLAQELLTRSIERFAEDHEPELLRLTREYLSKLTAGRYVSVEHDKANPGQFLVRNDRDQAYVPSRLSTGTREQLYLAIRMAFISHHCRDHEPLPVVMDDCFVNFDDQRTRYAMESVAQWDDSLQTILLSCHSRVVRLLADLAPETPVLHLENGQTSSAGIAVEQWKMAP